MTIIQAEQILKLLTELKEAVTRLEESGERQEQELAQIRERVYDIELDYGTGYSVDE